MAVSTTLMDQTLWLTGNDPAAMIAHLKQVGMWAERKQRLVAHASTQIYYDPHKWTVGACDVIRDIFGNPFRRVLTPDEFHEVLRASWQTPAAGRPPFPYPHEYFDYKTWGAILSWRDGTITGIARSLSETGDFSPESMSVMADALEEAGCTSKRMLDHLRGTERCPLPGEHVHKTTARSLYEAERLSADAPGFAICDGRLRQRHVRECWVLEMLAPHVEFVMDPWAKQMMDAPFSPKSIGFLHRGDF